MKKILIFIIWLMGSLLLTVPVSAQQVHAQALEASSIPGRPGWMKFERNVIITYGNIRILSNYAEVNQATRDFEAHGNLRIRTGNGGVITGKTLRNDPRRDVMIVNEDVVFTDRDSSKLFTDQMIYNRLTEVSTYTTGGQIITADSTVLTSLIGHIHSKTNAFHGKTNVVIVNPDYLIHTDTMQMLNDMIYFFSATHVWSDSNYLYCESGWYNSKEKIASLADNAFIQTPDYEMYADSIYYEMNIDFGEAFENVVVIDTANDIIVHSDFALSDRRIGDAWFTKNAFAIMISDGDSLWLRGDTLRIAYDTNTNDAQYMRAYHDVRFFRHDMQGASDSLSYVIADSTLTLFGTPIVWTGNDQMTGDTIRILLSENRLKYMYLLRQAFIASKGHHEGHFNQVKGREVIGFFNDSSELETIKVFENVETIYFVTDDADSSLIGILKLNAEEMEMRVENRAIVNINYLRPDEKGGSMFPDAGLPVTERFLRGFSWQTDRRPRSKYDILPATNEIQLPLFRSDRDTIETP
jgi:lipopolysaccharide export system protein LptA